MLRGAKVGRGVSVEEDGNRMEELNLHRTKLWITLQLTGSANYVKEVQANECHRTTISILLSGNSTNPGSF